MIEPAEEASNDSPGDSWRRGGRRIILAAAVAAALVFALLYAALRPPAPICLAAANSLTGPSAPAGQESLAAIELAVDQANRQGGVHGRRIELVRFDDRSTAEGARANVPAIAASDCVAVIGHYLSTASLAAGPLYKAARIPALTGTSFVDELTTGNPYYFRAQTTASVQGRSTAEYLSVFNESPPVELIHSDDSFGRSYRDGFSSVYGNGRLRTWSFDPRRDARTASARAVAEQIAAQPRRGIIVIGTAADNIADVLMAVTRRGLSGTVITTGGAGSEEFLQRFRHEPEEKKRPGFFTENLYATPPLIFDSAGAEAQKLAAAYRRKTHRQPGWIAAGAYDASLMMIEALRRAGVDNRRETLREDRERVRAALAGMTSLQSSVQGITRPLYFDANRDMPGPVRFGFFRRGRFITAPRQLVTVENLAAEDAAEELRQGRIVRIGSDFYWLQQVIYTGIDFNRINRIDLKEGTFNADINLWMRFSGDPAAPVQIEFPALLDRGAFDPAKPLETDKIYDLEYRLYRIVGNFKGDFDLHEYPFDEQQLLVRFQNRRYRSELVTYAIDSFGLKLANSNRQVPEDLTAFQHLQQWRLTGLRYFVDSLSTSSTFGKPSLFGDNVETKFAGFNATVLLKRNFAVYVVKSLIPLVLLIMVVFVSLFMPENAFRDRNSMPVTAILTTAVLLLSVNNQLGEVGYTVAIEYIFYAFFFLCLGTLVVNIAHTTLVKAGRSQEAWRVARIGQHLYVLAVAMMVLFFWWRYARD